MKKLLFLLVFIPLVSFGQEKATFKDGNLDISQLVSSCQKAFNSEGMKKTINTENYCKCFVKKFAKDFTYNELKNLIYYGNTEDARLFFESNEKEVMECMFSSLTKQEPIIDLELLKTNEGRRQIIEVVRPKLLQKFPEYIRKRFIDLEVFTMKHMTSFVDDLVICYIEGINETNLITKALNNNLGPTELELEATILYNCLAEFNYKIWERGREDEERAPTIDGRKTWTTYYHLEGANYTFRELLARYSSLTQYKNTPLSGAIDVNVHGQAANNTRVRRNYTESFGSWKKKTSFPLEHYYNRYGYNNSEDPFELHDIKSINPVRRTESTVKGKSLNSKGSKNLKITITQDHYAIMDRFDKGWGEAPDDVNRPYYDLKSIILYNFIESPDFKFIDNPDYNRYLPIDSSNEMYLNEQKKGVFRFIIDNQYIWSFTVNIGGNYSDSPLPMYLNNWNSDFENKNLLDFLEKLKTGRKLYIKFDKLFIWNGYVDDELEKIDTSITDDSYYVPIYTYEFDLTGSSKALSFY